VAAAALLLAGLARAQVGPEGEAPPDAPAAPMGEEIVVTGTRTPRPVRNAPEAVTVLPRSEIDRSPSKTVDELLRVVPSFGLFRRTSSLVSDPSAQGVNLRGVGPSGVSRSLVLVDGIPANDPFGGWVYWRAIPRLGIDHVEVVPGGGSAVYGNYALGGVTQVFTQPIAPTAAAATECGTFESCSLAARGAQRWGSVGASVEGEYLTSQGYPLVAPSARGPIDADQSPSKHGNVNARLEAKAAPDLTLSARGGWFHEEENGGTEFTTAGARRLEYTASARWAPESAGALDLAVFGHKSEFQQQRAAVTSTPTCTRCSEKLGASQDVLAHDLGATVAFTTRPLSLAGAHTLMAGTEARRITGDTGEDLFTGNIPRRDAGGEQRLYGAFAEDVYDVSDAISTTLALRYDRWENRNAYRTDTKHVDFPDRVDHSLSPKLGLRYRPLEWLSLRAAAYRAFRAPTLNELYRPFQVGLVRTLANENLGAETLTGAEAGFDVAIARGLAGRVTGFWNELRDPITNVTIGTNLRQRENLGKARIRGYEAEVGWRIGRPWVATVSYTFVDATVTDAPGQQPPLVGKELPQDPRHRGTASWAFDDPRLFTAAVQVRYIGRQFEDDQNTSPMAGVWLVDLSLARRVAPGVDLVLAVENLFDREYLVGRAGVDTIGQPRFVHGGIRLHYGG
jgi:outer membrane receptor protein involved in Fe transport